MYLFALLHNHPLSNCASQDTFAYPSSTVSVFAQSLASILFHEIVEAISNKDVTNGLWQDRSPAENADVCSWCFGTNEVRFADNGAAYNIVLGPDNVQYLI